MNIVNKLILAGVAVCAFTVATPAQAWHGRGHYYGGRHYWHGRWYGPGYYGPTVFVGSPFYWGGWGPGYYGGPNVSFAFGGGYGGYGGYYYRHGHRYYRHYRHYHHR